MANWKKVLVSGSNIEITSITSSATPTIGSIGTNYVTMIDPTTGFVSKITSGNFQASLGSYAYTASAVTGTPVIIGAADTLTISGSSGLTSAITTVAGGAKINVSANAGNGITVVGNSITVDTGSAHFTSGVKNTTFTAGNFVDSPEIDFTVTTGTSVTAALINGSIANAKLTNSTISGKALGTNLDSHTAGVGLLGTAYNGSAAQTWTVDSGSMLPFYTSSTFAKVSGDITITAGGVSAIGSSKVTNAMLVNSSIYIAAGNGLTGDASTALGATASLAVGAGSGIAVAADSVALKNAGSLTNNTLTKWDSGNTQLVDSGVTDDGTTITLGRNTNVTGRLTVSGALTGSAVSASGTVSGGTLTSGGTISAVSTITAGTGLSTTTGNITSPAGYVRAGTPSPAGSGITGNVEGQLGWFNTLTSTGDLTVSGNATVTGNLTVAGTASFTNSTSLLIADKFALLASGSTSLTDGGIIIQNTAGGIGTAFYLEAGSAGSTGTYGRFAVTGSLAANATTATVDEFFVTVKTNTGLPLADPTFGGSTSGYGNIYVNSSNGDIFIYS